MANVRSPNIDFTLGTPGNRPQMSAPVNPVAEVALPVTVYPVRAQPQGTTLAPTAGGQVSYPIAG